MSERDLIQRLEQLARAVQRVERRLDQLVTALEPQADPEPPEADSADS